MQNRQDKQNRELTAQRGVVDDNDGNYLANTISERGDMCCSGATSTPQSSSPTDKLSVRKCTCTASFVFYVCRVK